MALKLIYLMFAKLLGWMMLRIRSDTTMDIEILVLRHQLAVLQRQTPRPRMCWADRAMIAAVALRLLYLICECRCGAPGRRTARLGAGDPM